MSQSNWTGRYGQHSWPGGLPWQPCTGCYRGDADRVLVVQGDVTWYCRTLELLMPRREAISTAEGARVEMGVEPDERALYLTRVCAECAEKTGIPTSLVTEMQSGAEVPVFAQPTEEDQ